MLGLRDIPVCFPTPVLTSATVWILQFSKYRGMLICILIDVIKKHCLHLTKITAVSSILNSIRELTKSSAGSGKFMLI